MEIRGELVRADFLLPPVVPRDPTKIVRLSSKCLKPLSLFASTECVLQNKTKLAKQAAAGRLLEPGSEPSQVNSASSGYKEQKQTHSRDRRVM